MLDLSRSIPIVREATTAILRLRRLPSEPARDDQPAAPTVQGTLVGSAFCIVADRYLLTAHHVLNKGQAREPTDKFYALTVPENGDLAYHFPVVSFPIERTDIDITVLEVGAFPFAQQHIPAIPLTFAGQPDGTRVITVGFPAPEINALNVDSELNYRGGTMFLKSHANDGIVSAQYIVGNARVYELNVGWHHGESGGPVVVLGETPAAFSLMQHYRNINSPHGVVAGPHRGCSLSTIESELRALGATAL